MSRAWLRPRWGVVLTTALALWLRLVDGADSWVFATEIVPVLTKAGCNAGACHGAATGQGGFRLSLLGYDVGDDYDRLARELGGRRIDLGRPEASLMLRKASGDLDHEGGRRLPRSSRGYQRIRDWIAAGAPRDPSDLRVAELEVEPSDILLDGAKVSTSLRVMATTSDGRRSDVTEWALYSSNDDAVATVNRTGDVVMAGPGLASVMVRYGGQAVAATVTVPWGARLEPDDEPEFDPRLFFEVDELVEWNLKRLGLRAAPVAAPATFYRRLYLDLLGRLPSPEELRERLGDDDSPSVREQAVEELLKREEFADHWAYRVSEWLGVGSRRASPKVAERWHGWLREQIGAGTPWNDIVHAMLVAEGDPAEVGPAGFYALASDPRDVAEQVASRFLGIRLACARCHAHPEDRWTQDDYHGFAACFARMTRDGGVIRSVATGALEHPKTGMPVEPALLRIVVSGEGVPRREADPRGHAAAWIAGMGSGSPELRLAFANRVWREVMGRGLVEPPDDLRPSRPASNPVLLARLADRLVSDGFDLRRLLRCIVTSKAYQRVSSWAGTADPVGGPPAALLERVQARAMSRPLSAEVFLDAVAQVSGVPEVFEGRPVGTRAIQLPGPVAAAPALDALGRCSRERTGESQGGVSGGLAQALHLIQGSAIQGRLGRGRVADWVSRGTPAGAIVDELWLRAFSRTPEAKEKALWVARIEAAGDRREAVEDLMWAVLNSAEFGFNH